MLLERYGLEVVMAFVKDMVRMWLHAWKRFISIALISLLGVAVLTGIYAGCRDAFLATDRFFDTQGLHDIQVLSTAGLTDDDIAALRKISGVAKVQGERSQTVTVDLNGKKTVTMQEIGTNGIDQPYLQSGRMPEKSGEIAVTRKFIKDSGYKKGDHITVTPQDSASSSVSDSAESDNQRRRANHTLISEPTTTSATPIQNGMPNVTPNRSVLEAVENSGVAYEPIASVSILPCSMPYPQHA